MAHLRTSWQVTQAAGESHATIRVQNLQTTAVVGSDAWGRLGKLQPVLISVSVSLRHAFSTASESDTVTNSTIHYGILSKAILGAVEEFKENGKRQDLRALLNGVAFALMGSYLDARSDVTSTTSSPTSLLNPAMVKALQISIRLPKASLIGNGVSLTGAAIYEENSTHVPACYSIALKLHDLRIPTIIGVNPNERLAKQIVVANLEIDRWLLSSEDGDTYAELEEIVVKTIEESSFQTLEALASHIGRRIIKFFLVPRTGSARHHVKISLEKPTAVTWADAPAVEMLLSSDTDPQLSTNRTVAVAVPFPLQGRLDEWIKHNFPDDST